MALRRLSPRVEGLSSRATVLYPEAMSRRRIVLTHTASLLVGLDAAAMAMSDIAPRDKR